MTRSYIPNNYFILLGIETKKGQFCKIIALGYIIENLREKKNKK